MEAVKMLCKQPRANINAIDTEGRTALMYSAEYGNYDCCEVLIGNKPSPDLNLTDNYGCNALHYAMCNDKGNTFIVRLLCQSGVSLQAKSVAGQTPFHLAAQQNQSSLIPILLEHHAEMDTTDGKGRTALMTAASEGHFEIVDLLIKAGANSNVKDVEGNTAENIAHIGGHQGIYEYLKELNETNPKSDTLQKVNYISVMVRKLLTITYGSEMTGVMLSVKPFKSKNLDKSYLDAPNPNLRKGCDRDFRATA